MALWVLGPIYTYKHSVDLRRCFDCTGVTVYFGSVRFFKHLILGIVWMVVVAVAVGITALAVFYGIEKEKSKVLEMKLAAAQGSIYIPNGVSGEEILMAVKNYGLTEEEILSLIDSKDPELIAKFYAAQHISASSGAGDSFQEPDYFNAYPELRVEPPQDFTRPKKTIYLTFDDGPSKNTLDILSILKKQDVKATFFMSGGESEESKAIMKQVAQADMGIGIHSISHDYEAIYESVDAYLADMDRTSAVIEGATGVKPDMLRFPGGSINNYNRFTYQQIIAEVTRRGYVYYDWDVSGQDAVSGANWTSIYNQVIKGVGNMGDEASAVVLLHDAADKGRTVLVVEDLIMELKRRGYVFAKLDHTVTPTNFAYVNTVNQ